MPSERMTYPHRQRAPGQIDCRCGAYASTDADLRAGTWGADCRVAMRAEIDRLRRTLSALDCRYTGGGVADVSGSHCPLGAPCERCAGERERDEARAAALHEAVAEVRGLALEYIDRTIRSGNYMSALTDATARIEALTTPARESEPARVDDVEGDL